MKHGYGSWDKIRQDIHKNKSLLFQHTVQGMNTDAIAKRCDYRMRQMEKELEVREKKLSSMKPPAVAEAEIALDAVKNMEAWELEAKMLEMQGEKPLPVTSFVKSGLDTLSEYVKERQSCIDRLREIETQMRGCKLLAEEAKLSIMQGDQGINLSHICLKAGGPRAGLNKSGKGYGVDLEARINSAVLAVPNCGDCKYCLDENNPKLCSSRRKIRQKLIEEEMSRLPAPDPLLFDETIDEDNIQKERKKPGRKKGWSKAMAESSAMWGGSSGSTKHGKGPGKGSIAQLIPDALIPELCRKITAKGTRIRDEIIKEFTTYHPEASQRQCLIKFQELTTKHKPDCVPQPEKVKGGRAWVFYLRPRFYHMLQENERPDGWEHAAAEDELLYTQECEKARAEKASAEAKAHEDDDNSNIYSSTVGTDVDSDDGTEQPSNVMETS